MDYISKTVQNKKIAIIRPDYTEGTEREAGPLMLCIQKVISEDNPAAIIINLGSVTFMDSNFLGGLVKGLKASLKAGCELILTDLQPPVRSMFELTKLHNIFQVHASEQHAEETL
ncbi:MAG: STAS domain-containing protein [Candidatus Cyclonatronum sp.]|uniref:STAS domain-containing protein n=1 Tax=Cyclonatronum sp. TaxID=3024185 RepID=UPI0025C12104|nr:STAS domain-containing protein [Cyclonatronum sp.]MCC5933554.1 STAS domain-containing protein [Balneolales bacterium]MCH8487838.1 STAS domain-containing protein [Cyclonatronum sp.]